MIADVNGDAISTIASSLSTLAVIASTLYARKKGQKRDPQMKRIEEKLDALVVRVERVERQMPSHHDDVHP